MTRFGSSTAISGDTALIGARNHWGAGAAYIFQFDGSEWVQQAKLMDPERGVRDRFGHRVAIAGDVAVITAPLDEDLGRASGSVHIYVWDGSKWVRTQKLLAPDGRLGDQFGSSVALSDQTLFIGAHDDDSHGANAGGVYVFERENSIWVYRQEFFPSDGQPGDGFGSNIAISGRRAIVSTVKHNDHTGAAYLFSFDGSAWIETAKLTASDGDRSDHFGSAVTFESETALIGAWGHSDHGTASGAVYEFSLDETDSDGDGVPDDCDNCPEPNPRQIDRCDANCDGNVDALDIEPFLELLVQAAEPCAPCVGDANKDGSINELDIEPFLECLFR